ncbi:MAG: DUF4214 domain-containing protein [Telluria sp.]
MATTYHNAIQKLYVAYFNRPADFAGLNYWETVVEAANGNTAAVSAAFAASAEYQTEYDQLTTAGVVSQVYQNLFGHAPDTAGLAFWVKALNDKAMTIDQVVTTIAAGAQGSDKVAYESKVLVASAFTAALDTPAEQTGYSGTMANDAAKAYLAGITTAAQATAAVAPAALAASVAAVIKAGVPFSLTTALADLVAAQEAEADFLAAADGDDDEDTVTTRAALELAVTNAEIALDVLVDGDYVGATDGVKAALLADEVEERAADLVTAQTAVTTATANIAKVAGLSAAVANLASSKAAVTAATKATLAANVTLQAAITTYNTANGATAAGDVVVAANGEATVFAADGVTPVPAITLVDGKLTIDATLSATVKANLAPVLAASVAKEAADKTETAAIATRDAAQLTLDRSDFITSADPAVSALDELIAVGTAMDIVQIAAGTAPTAAQIMTEINALAAVKAAADKAVADAAVPTQAQLDAQTAANTAVTTFANAVAAFDAADNANPLADALATAEGGVTTANTAIKALNTAITNLEAAAELVVELDGLEEVTGAAEEVFTDEGFEMPITVGGVIGATAESDIYVAGDVDSIIVNFGLVGDDMLFIGTDYTLNTSTKVTTGGNNSVLEVFLIQNGADTEVHLEQVTFGSASTAEAEVIITLTGVTVADVSLANGIITVG